MKYPFRESVAAYLDNRATQTAVDVLLATKPNKLDVDSWEDIVPYIRAYAGAQAVRCDWAESLFDVWHQVWDDGPPPPWLKLSPHDQVAEWEWGLDLEHLWDDSSLVQVFNTGNFYLLEAVSFELETGVQLGFGIFDKTGKTLLTDVFEYVSGDNELRWSAEGLVPLRANVDLAPLRSLATELLARASPLLPSPIGMTA